MGLTNAPAMFIQMMDNLFIDMLDKGIVVILDDILIHSIIHSRGILQTSREGVCMLA